MKTHKGLLILILAVALLAGCQSQAPEAMPVAERSSAPQSYDSAGSGMKVADGSRSASNTQADRIVIKNANLQIVVEKPFESMNTIMTLASEMGGYVVNSRTYKSASENGSEVPEAEITIRVTSEKLDAALERIRGMVKNKDTDIRSENITGQDITMEYIDLKSRLATYEQTEKQLMRIQETATKVEDVLNILTRLNEVRQQIESLKGQIKYYDESTRLSAIYVRLIAAEGINPISIGGWQPLGVARDALQALVSIGQFLVNALIVIVIVILPLFAIFYFPGRWIYRKVRQNRAKSTSVQDFYPPTQPKSPSDLKK